MKVVSLKCPECGAGANIKLKPDKPMALCVYCGVALTIDDGSKNININKNINVTKRKIDDAELKKLEIVENENKRNHKLLKWYMIGFVILITVVFGGAYFSHVSQDMRLQRIVTQIEIDISNGDFDSALAKANSLHYTADWNRDTKRKWNNTRDSMIRIIEDTRKSETQAKVPSSASNYRGRNYEQVVRELESAGFTDIEVIGQLNLTPGRRDEDEGIESISIGGDTNFKRNAIFTKESRVIITYHVFGIQTPSSARSFRGSDYEQVVQKLENAGFTNIEIIVQKDLVSGWFVNDNLVESVSIDGDDNFSKGTWFIKEAKVIIIYRTYPDDD